MPSNKNSNSNSSISMQSLSFGKGKNGLAGLVLVILLCLAITAYYHMYKSNRLEPFEDAESSDIVSIPKTGGAPNLKVENGECVVALFYADWCPHCVKFKPSFNKAKGLLDGKKFKGKVMRFVLGDCDAYKNLSKDYDVNGYPTVKILNDNNKQTAVEYDGERTFDGLKDYFITDN